MAKFVVKYCDAKGKIKNDLVEAKSERAAIAQLEASGKTPISIKAATEAKRKESGAKSSKPHSQSGKVRRVRGGGARRRARLDFTHQLAAVAESGIPLIAGLKAVGEQTKHPELSDAINRIVGRIEGGRSLADALDAETTWFSELYVKTIAAGEAAGKVPEVLNALARYQEQETETRSQIRSAMMYPMMVVGALVLASTFMLIFVVPQFAAMFDKFNGQLPLPTRMLLAISGAITHHYVLVSIGLVLTIVFVRYAMGFSKVRAWLDKNVLRLPVFGNLLIGVYMVRLIELMDLLTQAALPITQSLRVTGDSMTNAALKADVRGMARAVEGGRSLTEAFGETRWLTPLVKRMLAIGEYAGRTDEIFAYLKKYYATQTERSVKMLSTLIEPVLVTALATVVLFFALAIFLPMWKLLKLVGNG